jgi:hypothetical protein
MNIGISNSFPRMNRLFRISPYVIGPLTWYYLGTHDRTTIRRNMFNHGLNVSQRFKQYPAWDNYVEPPNFSN